MQHGNIAAQLKRDAERWLSAVNQPSQRHRLQKLELQQSLRIHYCRAGRMAVMRLAPGLWRTCWLNVVRLYRGPASIQIN